MTLPVRTQIGQALVALVVAAELEDDAGNAPSVELNRDSAVTAWPAVVITLGAETHSEISHLETEVVMSVSIEGHVQAPLTAETDEARLGALLGEAIDLLYAQVAKAVLAWPRQLGGLCENMFSNGMTPFTAGGASVRTGGFEWTLEVKYQTAADNPFSQTIGD